LKLWTSQSQGGEAARAKLFSLLGLTAVTLCLCFYKILSTSRAQAQVDGDRAQGCARSAASSTDVLSADSVLCEKKGAFFGYFLCTSKESDPRSSIAEALALERTSVTNT
jgi:hypothetical protein